MFQLSSCFVFAIIGGQLVAAAEGGKLTRRTERNNLEPSHESNTASVDANGVIISDAVRTNRSSQDPEGYIRWTMHQDRCLDVEGTGGGVSNGHKVQMYTCGDLHAEGSRDMWLLPSSGSGTIRFAANPEKCLDVDMGKKE